MHCSEVDETATGSANFWSGVLPMGAAGGHSSSWPSTLLQSSSFVVACTASPSWASPGDEFSGLGACPYLVARSGSGGGSRQLKRTAKGDHSVRTPR